MAGRKKANPHVTAFFGVSQEQQLDWIASHGNFGIIADLDAWDRKKGLCKRWCVVFPQDTIEECVEKYRKYFPEEFKRDMEGTKEMAQLLMNPSGMSIGKTVMLEHSWPPRLLEIVLMFHPHLGSKDDAEGMRQARELGQIAYKLCTPKKA